MRLPVLLAALVIACSEAVGRAQGAPPQKPAPPAAAPAQPPAPGQTAATPPAEKPAAEVYTYNPEGRRDPFVSLLARGVSSPSKTTGRAVAGVANLTVGEITLRGVMQSRGGYVAMVQGPDNKTYLVHPNDRLADGTVKAITPEALIIMQDVSDPLSLVKQREVRKVLRGSDQGK